MDKPTKVRVWSAVRVDGVVQAEFVEVPVGDQGAYLVHNDERRWMWVYCVMDGLPSMPEWRHLKGCGPGQPCRHCHDRARKWWVEWARREAEREAEKMLGEMKAPRNPGLFGASDG